jgi:hypothetical protein
MARLYMREFLISALLLGAIAGSCAAQGNLENGLDEQYTPPEDSPFSESKKGQQGGGGSDSPLNALLFETTLLPRGVAAVTYRRQINRLPVSVFGGLGHVFAKDFVWDVASLFDSEGSPDTELQLSAFYEGSSITDGKRFFGQVGIRVNTSGSNDIEDSGLELGMRWHKYQLKPVFDEEIRASSLSVAHSTLYLAWNNTQVGGGRHPFISVFNVGFGYQFTSFDALVNGFDSDGSYYVKSGKQAKMANLTLLLTYSLGIGW